ncbi:hypothetical protein [Cellulomonas oligotrophica]|uniref:Uncharacterized protein n=1 Tax=Cellulomonas oligotrophica TaxID=931536 RepID=A0A7Y9FCW9_9CELL|nr:hypothetical protein [Cellulomonas oligotrophica]NYD84930.1 hypothetical protein [Cellulomonas oligotrophica]GIG32000.1 hypothetical protein Col01nite_11590 [Cellulomonas oligotrophica]
MTTQPATTAPGLTDVGVLVAAVVGALGSLVTPWGGALVLAALLTALRMLVGAPRRRRLLWSAVVVCVLSLAFMTLVTVAVWTVGT